MMEGAAMSSLRIKIEEFFSINEWKQANRSEKAVLPPFYHWIKTKRGF